MILLRFSIMRLLHLCWRPALGVARLARGASRLPERISAIGSSARRCICQNTSDQNQSDQRHSIVHQHPLILLLHPLSAARCAPALPRLRIDARERSSVSQSMALAKSCRLLAKRSPPKFSDIWYTLSLTNSELPNDDQARVAGRAVRSNRLPPPPQSPLPPPPRHRLCDCERRIFAQEKALK